jgi:hypothetical protein
MRATISTDLLLRFLQATPKQKAAIGRILYEEAGPAPERGPPPACAPPPGQPPVPAGAPGPATEATLTAAGDFRTVLAEIYRQIGAVAQGTYDLRKENRQLQDENESLRAMQDGGFFNFVLQVEREDFLAFAFVMALGNRSAAAESLQVPQRSFYDRLERWQTRGKSYQQMLRWIEWRKAVGRKIKLRLPDPEDSGSADETGVNPDVLREVVEAAGESSSQNYPSLLREILGVLLAQNPKNWESARRDLVGLIKEELPQ